MISAAVVAVLIAGGCYVAGVQASHCETISAVVFLLVGYNLSRAKYLDMHLGLEQSDQAASEAGKKGWTGDEEAPNNAVSSG